MNKISELCKTSEQAEDSFVGIKFNKNIIDIIFPLGYNIPKNNEDDCKKSVINLIKTISFAKKNTLDEEEVGDYSNDEDGMPVDSYMWIITDYIDNGLFTNNEKNYIQQQTGKINWKRTFKTKFLISEDSLVYLNPIVEKKSINQNIITEIHSFCIDKSIDKIGILYNGISKIGLVKANEKRIEYYIQVINNERIRTFDDRKKLLLHHLERILRENMDHGNNKIRNFGVNKFEHVWEKLVDKVFGDPNINNYYPTTKYYLNDSKKPYMPSKLRPDSFFIDKHNFYIIDSKYYKYGITHKNKDLPSSDSIQKQVTYGDFIDKNYKNNKLIEIDSIYNAFIIPYNKSNNKFDTNNRIVYCGYAFCDWKDV